MPIDDGRGGEIARRRAGTPRIANRLLRRVRDYAQVRADGTITPDVARAALALLEVDEHGFDEIDRRLLRTIIDKFGGGPVGVASIAAAISEERDAIEDIYEPFLIQIGFLDRTPRGRVATARAYEYFGLDAPQKDTIVVNAPVMQPQARAMRAGQDRRPRDLRAAALLTNADLEKMVDTSDEWILQRTGIRERHIAEPGVGDLGSGEGSRAGAIARGAASRPTRHRLHRRRHDDARHDVSEHGVHAAGQDRRAPRLGLRPRRGLLGLHLCADHRRCRWWRPARTTTRSWSAPT